MEQMTPQQNFFSMLNQRKLDFLPEGERQVQSRQTYSDLGEDMQGEYYVVTFQFENNYFEQVTFELIEDELKLMGYRYFSSD